MCEYCAAGSFAACLKGFWRLLSGVLTTETVVNRVPGVPGPKNPAGFGSDPDPVADSTRPGKTRRVPGVVF